MTSLAMTSLAKPAFGAADPGRPVAANRMREGADGPPAGAPLVTLSGVSKQFKNGVTALAYSPDGLLLATATGFHDRVVRIWDVPRRTVRTELRGHLHTVNRVAFSRDGRLLATGSNDKTAILWDVAQGKEQATLRGHESAVTSLAFAPDGKTLATVSAWDRVIKLWDVATDDPKGR